MNDEDFEDMEDEELFDGDQNRDLMDQNLVDENRKYMMANGLETEENDGYQSQPEVIDDNDNSSIGEDENQNAFEEQKQYT